MDNTYLTETEITTDSIQEVGPVQSNMPVADTYTAKVVDIPQTDVDVLSNMNHNYSNIVNLLVLIAIFVLAKFIFSRFLLKAKRGQNKASENLAYSISVFSLFISLSVIITSVIYGNMPSNFYDTIFKLINYSALGIILLILSGLIFDRIALTKVHLNNEVAKGNMAAAFVDAGNFIASALIIASALKWYEFKTYEGIMAILSMYVASQVILTISTLVRKKLIEYPDRSFNFEQQILLKNNAAAIAFAGRRIGTALAITAATNLLPFQQGYALTSILSEWLLASIIIVIFFNIISWVSSKIILWKDINSNIVNKNINAALIDSSIYIGFGLILASTLM